MKLECSLAACANSMQLDIETIDEIDPSNELGRAFAAGWIVKPFRCGINDMRWHCSEEHYIEFSYMYAQILVDSLGEERASMFWRFEPGPDRAGNYLRRISTMGWPWPDELPWPTYTDEPAQPMGGWKFKMLLSESEKS